MPLGKPDRPAADATPLPRPERAEDEAFLRTLFREAHGGVLAGLDPALAEMLLRQQFAGQAMTYHARYPDARFDIIEHDGVPVGRMIVDQADEAVTLVDIALLAEWRGRGLGTRLLRALMDVADASGRPVRLSVDPANAGALRLYTRLGFAVVAAQTMSVTMERPPTART